MQRIFAALLASLFMSPAFAQEVGAPAVKPQDSWIYGHTVEDRTGWHHTRVEHTVVRVGSSDILLAIKEAGSTAPPREQLVGADWSRFRNVNGKEVVVNRPFAFPLVPGKTWEVEYTEEHPNAEHSKEHVQLRFTVVGWEDVTVPAGTLRAMKVEAEGHWTADLAPAASAATASRVDAQGATVVMRTNKVIPQTATGRLYKAFWYSPDAKRSAKALEEYYGSNGVRTERLTDELESFKPAK